jgi:hypothetical protein
VEETAGAYYAARLGVLEHLVDRGRQAKCLVLREVTDAYWAPVGVWQVREGVRNAFDADRRADSLGFDQPAVAESFHEAITTVAERLPISPGRLRRKSAMVAGLQAQLSDF